VCFAKKKYTAGSAKNCASAFHLSWQELRAVGLFCSTQWRRAVDAELAEDIAYLRGNMGPH
jgi:hypothetical protein